LIRGDRQSVQNSESPQFGFCSSLLRRKSIRPNRISRKGTARTTDSGRQLMPIMNMWWNDKTNSITAAIESIRRALSPISRNPTSRQVISQMVYGGDGGEYIAPDSPATRQPAGQSVRSLSPVWSGRIALDFPTALGNAPILGRRRSDRPCSPRWDQLGDLAYFKGKSLSLILHLASLLQNSLKRYWLWSHCCFHLFWKP
jgi:hypothetical protein